jgi:hypothetical protein
MGHATAGDADPASAAGGSDGAQARQNELKQKAANVTALVCVGAVAWLCAQWCMCAHGAECVAWTCAALHGQEQDAIFRVPGDFFF